MSYGLGHLFRIDITQKREVPVANCRKSSQRFGRIVRTILLGPLLLVEGLDNVMIFRQRLPQTESKE